MIDKVLIGRTQQTKRNAISGFSSSEVTINEMEPIHLKGPHSLTIAPTGSGKGVNCVIPTLLQYDGPVIVIDPKAEALAVTKRCREEMGHKVVVLDPFKVTKGKRDTLNPMDIKSLSNFDIDTDSYELAYILSGGYTSHTDPYWDAMGRQLIGGVLSIIFSTRPAKSQNFTELKKLVIGDVDYELAVILDTQKDKMTTNAYNAIAAYLATPSDRTRPCITSTVASYFSSLLSESVDNFFSKSSFKLQDIIDGKPIDIFLVIPPEKIKSHGRILQIIMAVLFKTIFSRKVIPPMPTLFLLDECASLGKFDPLIAMITMARGYGVHVHSIWQNIAQLKEAYGNSYQTILNNSEMWQVFGANKYLVAKDIAEMCGIEMRDIMRLGTKEQVLYNTDNLYCPCRRVNYLEDDEFKGKFDPNPFYNNLLSI